MARLSALLVGLLVCGGCGSTAVRSAGRPLDISGCWRGTWSGFGIVDIPRESGVRARFSQRGPTGRGWITVDDTPSSESVPIALRRAGNVGAPLILDAHPTFVIARDEVTGDRVAAEFWIVNGQLFGRMANTDLPFRMRLTREDCSRVAQAPVPAPAAAVETAPPPAPSPSPQAAPLPAPLDARRAVPEPTTFSARDELTPIYFDFDAAAIRSSDRRALDATVQWLKGTPDALVLIEGHCDERGTNDYNLVLGERRARAAMQYLVDHGIAADRISLVSYGEERPVCGDQSEACWARNRRAMFLVKSR